jgi:hypothetical protein
MPDYLHILAEGTQPGADLREFIRIFKQDTAFAFRKTCSTRLWEKSYYDYILRPSDCVESVACYIWWNPVRQHLCECPRAYGFSGSQTIDWMKSVQQVSSWAAPWKSNEPA